MGFRSPTRVYTGPFHPPNAQIERSLQSPHSESPSSVVAHHSSSTCSCRRRRRRVQGWPSSLRPNHPARACTRKGAEGTRRSQIGQGGHSLQSQSPPQHRRPPTPTNPRYLAFPLLPLVSSISLPSPPMPRPREAVMRLLLQWQRGLFRTP